MTQRVTTTIVMSAVLLAASTVAARAVAPEVFGGQVKQSPAAEKAARVQRGAYLVRTMGCNDCHTPLKMGPKGPEPDMTRSLNGHPQDVVMPPPPALPPGPWLTLNAATNTAFAGPWGVSFAANLTPDKETGLGNWTEEMFIATMRTGRHQGKGRAILPPMPYFMIGAAHDDEIKAIFAYLQSLPPVKNRVPAPIDPAGPESR